MSESNRAGDCFDWRDDAVPSLLTLRGLSSFPQIFSLHCISRMEGNLIFPLLLLLVSASSCFAQLPLPHLDPRSPITFGHNEGLPSLLALLKTLPKTTTGSGIPLRPCSFKATTQRLEAGTCTWYGACRFQGRDYMYQVRLEASFCHNSHHLGENYNISAFRVAVERQGVGEPTGRRGGFAICL